MINKKQFLNKIEKGVKVEFKPTLKKIRVEPNVGIILQGGIKTKALQGTQASGMKTIPKKNLSVKNSKKQKRIEVQGTNSNFSKLKYLKEKSLPEITEAEKRTEKKRFDSLFKNIHKMHND